MTTDDHRRCVDIPRRAWYAAATADEVGRTPLARRVLGEPVLLYRTLAGTAVALADRCAHRPIPLSLGRIDGDDVVAAYTGFRYGPDGRCLAVPTQENVPFGTQVRAYPVHEDGSFVWVWPGEPNLAPLRPPPRLPWLSDSGWATFGDAWETAASLHLMHDNFADISHVPFLDPEIAPPALVGVTPPPLNVSVSETTVSFHREFPSAPMAPWQAALLRIPPDAAHEHREEGGFVSPGVWVDRWDITVTGHGDSDGVHSFVFSHALTPVDDTTTRHVWRVSRNFGLHPATEGTLVPLFRNYYNLVRDALETMQRVLDTDGPRPEVLVAADAAGAQVRRIMARLLADEAAR